MYIFYVKISSTDLQHCCSNWTQNRKNCWNKVKLMHCQFKITLTPNTLIGDILPISSIIVWPPTANLKEIRVNLWVLIIATKLTNMCCTTLHFLQSSDYLHGNIYSYLVTVRKHRIYYNAIFSPAFECFNIVVVMLIFNVTFTTVINHKASNLNIFDQLVNVSLCSLHETLFIVVQILHSFRPFSLSNWKPEKICLTFGNKEMLMRLKYRVG